MNISRLTDLTLQTAARISSRAGLAKAFTRALRRPLPQNNETALIHFVCQGNILRSAYAGVQLNALLKDRGLEQFSVSSSGTATQNGKPADPRGRKIALRRGSSLEEHSAQNITAEEIERAWLVVTMDRALQTFILKNFPAAKPKILLLGALLLDEGEGPYIPDPYTKDEAYIDRCYGIIDRAVQKLVEELPAGSSVF